MENRIIELWRAEVGDCMARACNEEMLEELRQLVVQSVQRIKERVEGEEQERLSRLADSYSELLELEQEEAFIKGFRLGMQLTMQGLL